MGRAMLIICAGVLISLGFVALSTSNTGMMLTEKNVNYAEFVMAKNAAHTAIQMAMQEINKDDEWPNNHGQDNPWVIEVQGRNVALHTAYYQDANYWEPDSLWLYSNSTYLDDYLQVRSLFLKQPFSSLVPDFEGSLTVAADPSLFTFSMSGSTNINGNSPTDYACEDKPAITTLPGAADNFSSIDGSSSVEGDPQVYESTDLSYQPTDELIARLANTDGVQYISGSYKGSMGTAEQPGVFFVENNAKLTGGISEGFGILVVRSTGYLEYEGDDGSILDIAGEFQFNGLVIFENAYNFDGNGTPTINGSVLVGHTEDYSGTPIDIDINGNLQLQYDCRGEDYARMAAANAVKQNKYTRVVSSENIRYSYDDQTEEAKNYGQWIKSLLGN